MWGRASSTPRAQAKIVGFRFALPNLQLKEKRAVSGFSLYSIVFYGLGVVVLASALLAVTRQNPVHAVLYLVASFLGTAALFYLMGAPLLAALEAILYAGAFLILFLFILMTVRPGAEAGPGRIRSRRWLPAAVLGGVSLVAVSIMIGIDPGGETPLLAAMARPEVFGRFLFEHYWFGVEAASFLLLVALVGALYLGRGREDLTALTSEDEP
jgi:NADH-quinone oxidoreductase subunit J